MGLNIAHIVDLKLNSAVNMTNKEYQEFDEYVKYLDDVESRSTIAIYKPKEKIK